MVLVAFYFMQQENSPVTLRQFFHRARKHNPIDRSGKTAVDSALFARRTTGFPIRRFIERNLA